MKNRDAIIDAIYIQSCKGSPKKNAADGGVAAVDNFTKSIKSSVIPLVIIILKAPEGASY